MLRHVAWLNKALVEPSVEGGLRSDDPRVVRRCLAPARELEQLGVECSVFGHMHDADPAHVCQHLQSLETDIVVIGGLERDSRLKLARAAKHLGCYVVVDLEDDIAADEVNQLFVLVDQVVTDSEVSAVKLERLGVSAVIIPDCEEPCVDARQRRDVAGQWLDCFRQIKMKPPVCANANAPTTARS
ncbi:MAG: hypothetical protein ABTQ34_01060 [Bdellovibrionales bacterium]